MIQQGDRMSVSTGRPVRHQGTFMQRRIADHAWTVQLGGCEESPALLVRNRYARLGTVRIRLLWQSPKSRAGRMALSAKGAFKAVFCKSRRV